MRGTVANDVTGAANTLPPIQVVLRLAQSGLVEPFGNFDTPTDGARNVTGSIAVTGWALDDVQVTAVRIYRNCVPVDEGRCQNVLGEQVVYIADAGFLEGRGRTCRQFIPPCRMRIAPAGGTCCSPTCCRTCRRTEGRGGQGDFTLYAVASDADSHLTLLGRCTIQVDNDNAQIPFGAIDTPWLRERASAARFRSSRGR